MPEHEPDSTDAVGSFFDSYASAFDSLYGHAESRGPVGRWIDRRFRSVMRVRFEEVLALCANPDIRTIIDIGCGPGRYLVEFARMGKTCVGVDLSDEMLGIARQLAERVDHLANIDLVQGDYLQEAFKTPFDSACLMGFFDYVEHPEAILKKLRNDVTGEIWASFPKAGGLLAFQRKIRYRMRRCPLWFYDEAEVHRLMWACGYGYHYTIKNLGRDFFVRARVE
jgi:SAM-dependent methyltransferase